jgi:hypothetical protein
LLIVRTAFDLAFAQGRHGPAVCRNQFERDTRVTVGVCHRECVGCESLVERVGLSSSKSSVNVDFPDGPTAITGESRFAGVVDCARRERIHSLVGVATLNRRNKQRQRDSLGADVAPEVVLDEQMQVVHETVVTVFRIAVTVKGQSSPEGVGRLSERSLDKWLSSSVDERVTGRSVSVSI